MILCFLGWLILSFHVAYGINRGQVFGFDGQLTDVHTHWQFLGKGYRAYDPTAHRFMRQDSWSPFGKGGINGYIFANNNPIMRFDRSGHASILNSVAITLAVGTAMALTDGAMGAVLGQLLETKWQSTLLGFAMNYTKNESILWGVGYMLGHQDPKAGAELAGLNYHGQVAVTNLLSTAAWAGINLSRDLEVWSLVSSDVKPDKLQNLSYVQNLLTKRMGPQFITSPFLLEGVASWGVNYTVTRLYQKKAWGRDDWINSAFSMVSGTLWGGMTEALPTAGLDGHLAQALGHTVWGATVNMLPGVISKGGSSLQDSERWLGAIQNSMVFSSLFSNLPEMYRF